MDTAQLQAFDAIVREGTFNLAAQRLGIAQSTISARIHNLEQEVGGDLFTRSRRVRLTQRGELFLDYARRALSVLEEGLETVNSAEQYRLRVAVTESLGGAFLAKVIGHYLDAHPRAQVFAQSTTCTQVLRMLQDRLVQFGLLPWPYPTAPATLRVLDLYQEQTALVCAPNHPLASRREVPLDELREGARPWHFTWLDSPADEALSPFGLDHRSPLNLPAQTVLSLLHEGRGVALMPSSVVRDAVIAERLVQLDIQGALPHVRTFALVHTGHEAVTSEARTAFRDAVASAAESLVIERLRPEGGALR